MTKDGKRPIDEYPILDKRLGRHVNHDPRSRAFPYRADPAEPLVTAFHHRGIPVLDQGNLGSCTGNALEGAVGTSPLYDAVDPYIERYPLATDAIADEHQAVTLYSEATAIDPYAGTYPPDDVGSDGLSVAKAGVAAGLISGYRHAFSLDDALHALSKGPVISGFNWYSDMDNPDPDGRVHPTGWVRGGHEVVFDSIDVENGRVWFTNSWGSWGLNGRAYLTFADWGKLLDEWGDVTVLTPANVPPPEPEPQPDFPIEPDPTGVWGFFVRCWRWLWSWIAS